MKTALSLIGAGLAIILASPMTAHAQDFAADNSTTSPSEILLASSTRPAFRNQQRFRYRYSMRRYRQHRYRRNHSRRYRY
jgi:uncharacterized membrane protein (UPF0182 family)